MRFIGKRSVASSKYLFFFGRAGLGIESMQTEEEVLELLTSAYATTLALEGGELTTTRLASPAGGNFLHVGIMPPVEDSTSMLDSLLPCFPRIESGRNAREHVTSTIQSDIDSPYAFKRTGKPLEGGTYYDLTFEECRHNTVFLLRPQLRGNYTAVMPKGASIRNTASKKPGSNSSYYRTYYTQIRSKAVGYNGTRESLIFARKDSLGAWGQVGWGAVTQEATFNPTPTLNVQETDVMIAVSGVSTGTSGSSVEYEASGATEESFVVAGKPTEPSAPLSVDIERALLVYRDSHLCRLSYVELTRGLDFDIDLGLSDGKNASVALASPFKNLVIGLN